MAGHRARVHHSDRQAAGRGQRAPVIPPNLPEGENRRNDRTPRGLRHSFVSIMSDNGVPIERIADLVGDAGGSRVTEEVCRHQIRLVLREGAGVMGKALKPKGRRLARGPRRAP